MAIVAIQNSSIKLPSSDGFHNLILGQMLKIFPTGKAVDTKGVRNAIELAVGNRIASDLHMKMLSQVKSTQEHLKKQDAETIEAPILPLIIKMVAQADLLSLNKGGDSLAKSAGKPIVEWQIKSSASLQHFLEESKNETVKVANTGFSHGLVSHSNQQKLDQLSQEGELSTSVEKLDGELREVFNILSKKKEVIQEERLEMKEEVQLKPVVLIKEEAKGHEFRVKETTTEIQPASMKQVIKHAVVTEIIHDSITTKVIKIQLEPQHLGEVEILLQVEDQKKITATIYAKHGETLEILRRDGRVLLDILNSSGLNMDLSDMNFSGEKNEERNSMQFSLFEEEQQEVLDKVYISEVSGGKVLDISI